MEFIQKNYGKNNQIKMNKKYTIKELKKNNVSLILSGGAAYGISHVGVIKFLEENNIKPKEILGTSMGAIIGAFYAVGYDSKKIEEILSKIKIKELMKFKLISAKLDYKNIYSLFKELFGEKLMSETIIDLKIATTNVDTGECRLFTKEDNIKIYDAVFCSMSIPGVFAPVEIEGNYYIDGGVSCNLPLEYAIKDNIKIGINVINKTKHYDYHHDGNLFARLKTAIKILKFTVHFLLENQTKAKIQYINNLILIEPDLNKFKKYEIGSYEGLINEGYSEIKKYFE